MLKCGYCGGENPDEAQACSGCGTPLAQSHEETTPSAEPSVGTPGGLVESALGVAGLVAGHPSGALHVLKGISKLEGDNPDSPQAMLERAAVLESVNMQAAVLLYQQILLKHPKSSAAKEARRNIQTLRVAHPELRL